MEPTTTPPSEKAAKETSYVVLARFGDEGFGVIDTVIVKGNGGQREARKIAYGHNKHVRDAVSEGEQVLLAAVPASSWKPTPIRLEQRDPRLVV